MRKRKSTQHKNERNKGVNPNQSRHHSRRSYESRNFSRTSERGPRYLSYVDKLKCGDKELCNTRDACQFFKILSKDYEDEKKLVLNFDREMESVLKEACELLSPDLSEPLKLLAALGGEALTMGVYKERMLSCFQTLYNSTDFILTLLQKLKTERLVVDNSHSVIAWFLIQLGKTGDEEILVDPHLKAIILFLESSNQVGFPQLSQQLEVVFQLQKLDHTVREMIESGVDDDNFESLQSAQQAMRPPGVRDHDNDKENFRSISIVPTTSELQCQEGAYLPLMGKSEFLENQEAAALDRQFRLMREDLLGTVKEELMAEFCIKASQRRRVFPEPMVVAFGMQPEPHLIVRVSLPTRIQKRIQSMKNPAAQDFFESGPGKRVLQKGTLVVLVHNKAQGKLTKKEQNLCLLAVGTIVERKKPMHIAKMTNFNSERKMRVLEVGISFTTESMRAIVPLLQDLKFKKGGVSMIQGGNGGLFNASAGLFSLQPILNALIRMDQVPMCNQLIHLQKPRTPNLAHGGKSFTDLNPQIQKAVSTDLSQKQALEEMFKSNIVLVQGPPGTGKTYIGVQMVKAMIDFAKNNAKNSPPLRILCLCYTNHALDSFLLDLINAGVPEKLFIRLGSSPKIDAKIKSRCLGGVSSSINTDFGRTERAAYAKIKQESETLEPRLKDIMKDISDSVWGKSLKWWQRISEWMEEYYYEEHDQLKTPDATDDDGFVLTGANGKDLQKNYLWERWCAGQDKGIFQNVNKDERNHEEAHDLWKLDKSERQCLICEWNKEWIEPQLELLESTMENLKKNTEALRTLRKENDLKVLKHATVIGCTTVAAAKFQGMINPNVIIVEEAGEILESHVLANLGKSCEQLIMIGDHKQLRPKIDNYKLQKESGNGYDLNISLFERLVVESQSNIPVIPLIVQHRMRPAISNLIRGMSLYQCLEDHERTHGRDHISGVVNDLVFIDHRHPEKIEEASLALGMDTKVNPYEAEMVVSIAKYIIQQGQYSSEQVTILTPYLGQLSLIRKALSDSDISSYLSDKDMSDLAQQNLIDGVIQKGNLTKIRIATVDNFQGEESHVVIISLVRSNSRDKKIGFLASEERVNVMLSRAREGMFIVGNLQTLSECSSKSGRLLWSNLKKNLECHNHCFECFPAVCQRHKTLQKLKCQQDFLDFSPEGGCGLKCTSILDCGHQCPLKCHGNMQHIHSNVKCKEKVEDVCANGHKQLRECSSVVKCMKTMNYLCPRGHSISGICHKGRPNTCRTCKMLEKLEKEEERVGEELETKLREHAEKLLATKVKHANMMKEKDYDSKLKTIQLEQSLLEKELAKNIENSINLKSSRSNDQFLKNMNASDGAKKKNVEVTDCEELELKNIGKTHSNSSCDRSNCNTDDKDEDSLRSFDSDGSPSSELELSNAFTTSQNNEIVSRKKQEEAIIAHSCSLKSSDFCDAVYQFKEGKFLEADDLIENCLNAEPSKNARKALKAFRYIIHDSLDPSGENWEEDVAPKIKEILSLEEAIQCWASFISLSSSKEFPLITKKLAESFYALNGSVGLVEDLIKIGRERAQIVIKEAQKAITTPTTLLRSIEMEMKEIQNDWETICKIDPKAPRVVNEEVLKLTGLKEIKHAIIDQYHCIRISQRQGGDTASSYNVRFEGNPGTGKTTIARFYSKFLQQLSVLPERSILIDVTAASLKCKGVSHLEDLLNKIKEAGGGVLFIDEAYQLKLDKEGERILDFILPLAESLDGPYGKLVWIFAGYPKEMDKLFEHNVGLPSRFPQRFVFADYTAEEMQSIFMGFMKFKDKKSSATTSKQLQKTDIFLPVGKGTINRYMGRTAFDGVHGEVFTDKFQNKWTCNKDKGLWLDHYGNSTGYHPNNVGDAQNPLASQNGQLWEYKIRFWVSSNGEKQKHFPGSPDPDENSSSKKELRNPPFRCEDEKYIRIAMRRLERQSNRPGFGNARTVRTLFDKVRERQARRIARSNQKKKICDDFLFTRDDILGIKKDEKELKNSKAYLNLQQMEGLKPVKEQIDVLIKLGTSNLKREESEQPVLDIILNRVFLGNPGTGKIIIDPTIFI